MYRAMPAVRTKESDTRQNRTAVRTGNGVGQRTALIAAQTHIRIETVVRRKAAIGSKVRAVRRETLSPHVAVMRRRTATAVAAVAAVAAKSLAEKAWRIGIMEHALVDHGEMPGPVIGRIAR